MVRYTGKERKESEELCCICGKDVSFGSLLYADRVPELNDVETRRDLGRKVPEASWVCVICDHTDSDGTIHNLEDIKLSLFASNDFASRLLNNTERQVLGNNGDG